MEWGIKLKNNDTMKRIVKNTFWSFIVECIIGLIIMVIAMIIIAEAISNLDFQWLYDDNPNLYLFLDNIYNTIFEKGYIFFILILSSLSLVLFLLYQLLKKIFSYISAISESADKLFDKNVEYINLPPEMSEVEKKLNHFKIEAIKNEKLAREKEEKKSYDYFSLLLLSDFAKS